MNYKYYRVIKGGQWSIWHLKPIHKLFHQNELRGRREQQKLNSGCKTIQVILEP